MRVFFAVPVLLFMLHSLSWAAEPALAPQLDLNDPGTLQEAIRVLDEEVKLAARPQTYVVIDLISNAIIIKGRGIELHRFAIERWTASRLADIAPTFRLQERPPVTRRKIDPAAGSELPPISLDDMPADFVLNFSPPLIVAIQPSTSDNLWRWFTAKGREWWMRIRSWIFILATGNTPSSTPSLHLTLAHNHAQSLAWTVTEGMPFLIRRASPN